MYDLNLNIPNITSKKYSNDSRFLLLKNYLYELNETISFALADKVAQEVASVSEKAEKDSKEHQAELEKIQTQSVSKFNELKENILSVFNYEDLSLECTDKAKALVADLRYYPYLNMVFVSLQLSAETTLSANVDHHLANLSQHIPGVFTPLQSFTDGDSGGQSTAGFKCETGELIFRSDISVITDSSIYISGFYIADYQKQKG